MEILGGGTDWGGKFFEKLIQPTPSNTICSMLKPAFRGLQLARLGHRGFQTSSFRFNAAQGSSSPEEILELGFKKLAQANAKKSAADLESLVTAGKKLDISETHIKQIYNEVEAGGKDYQDLSAFERSQIDKVDAAMFGPTGNVDDTFPVFNHDDLPSLGHLQLRDHRVQREYNRIAAYDLPQLAQYAQEYRAPKQGKDVLKFRYTVYLGEENHPGASKISVSFNPDDLGLTDAQSHKLKLIAGTRFDPTKNEVKISAQKFPQQAQNKRYLANIVKDLLAASKDDADSFSDIPLDTRHIEARTRRLKPRYPRHEFPEEWKRPQDAPAKNTDFVSELTGSVI